MVLGKLYTSSGSSRQFKVLIAAKYVGVDIETTPNFQISTDTRTPEFLAKFPIGKVPAFETPEGFAVTDSTAIAYYVASKGNNPDFLGKTPEETASILQYLFFASAEISGTVAQTIYPRLGYTPYVKPAVQAGDALLKRFLVALNNILLDKTFLVGDRVTIADISLVCDLMAPFSTLVDKAYRKEIRNVTRYFTTIINQPKVKAVIGDFTFCETPIEYVPPKKEEKPKKKEAAPAPAAATAAAAAAPAATATEAKPESAAPKPKSKLDLLPKSSFNLEDWKRFYSNNDTKPTAMDYFWKNLDPEGYSIWKVNYKYNNELTLTFMTNNLIGGFFNRLGRATKYAFGTLLTLGVDNDNEIAGYMVIRGQEIPEEVSEAADFDSYTFVKVDPSDPKTREEVGDYFAWEGPTLPRPCYDGKVFK